MLPFFRRLLLGALLISDYLEQKDYNLLFMVMTIQQFNSNANASGSVGTEQHKAGYWDLQNEVWQRRAKNVLNV